MFRCPAISMRRLKGIWGGLSLLPGSPRASFQFTDVGLAKVPPGELLLGELLLESRGTNLLTKRHSTCPLQCTRD